VEQNQPRQPNENPARIKSFTRLLVGGIEIGWESLLARLDAWEGAVDQEQSNLLQNTAQASAQPLLQSNAGIPPSSEVILVESRDVDDSQVERIQVSADQIEGVPLPATIRHTLLGVLFAAQDRFLESAKSFAKIDRDLYQAASPIINPLSRIVSSQSFTPMRDRFERYVDRGQQEVDQLAQLGRLEERHSRALVEQAFFQSVDGSLDYLAQNEGIQELVQTQGTSLATDMIYEVRERTVSADNLVEGLIRYILRRPSRTDLPLPPLEVIESVSSKKPKGTLK
jgi:hypothetical protein